MNVTARPASDADAAAVADIAAAIRVELAPLRGGAVLLAQQYRRSATSDGAIGVGLGDHNAGSTGVDAGRVDSTDAAAFVGTIDDVVVGFATVSVQTLLDGSRLGVIDELGVLLEARGVGVGEAMLDEVVAYCRRKKCRGIDSFALPGTRETKNFFETFGFTARLLVVHTNLEAQDAADAESTPAIESS